MTEEEVKAKMQEGFAKIKPKVAEMTNIIMDAYQEGFNTCWELLTGQKIERYEGSKSFMDRQL